MGRSWMLERERETTNPAGMLVVGSGCDVGKRERDYQPCRDACSGAQLDVGKRERLPTLQGCL